MQFINRFIKWHGLGFITMVFFPEISQSLFRDELSLGSDSNIHDQVPNNFDKLVNGYFSALLRLCGPSKNYN